MTSAVVPLSSVCKAKVKHSVGLMLQISDGTCR